MSKATVLIDAEPGRRIDVALGRIADVAEKWLLDHSEAEIVCRDGSGAYGEAVSRGLPAAVHVGDRWHLSQRTAKRCLTDGGKRSSIGPLSPGAGGSLSRGSLGRAHWRRHAHHAVRVDRRPPRRS